MGRAIDLMITYRVIKMLVTPFEKHEAFKLGIIDNKGKVLKKNKMLTTAKEKNAYTLLHRFVFNLKRLMNAIPGVKSKIGTYAVALALLLKEDKNIPKDPLEKQLYKFLKKEGHLILDDDIKESVGFDYLPKGRYTMVDRLENLEGIETADVGDIVYTTNDSKPTDTYLGTHLYDVINEESKKIIRVSEDNIERIRL
jgi:hypothetical protein